MTTDTKTTENTVTPAQLLTRGTNVDGNYTFMPYSPKAPVTAQDGYRVSKVMYKTNTKTGTIAGENSCVIIPVIEQDSVTANMDRLMKHVVTMLELEQDKIVKTAHLDKANERNVVTRDAITLDAIIIALETEAVSGRINKEGITAWFDLYIKENLAMLFADKLGCDLDQLDVATSKLSLTLKVYSDMFGKMASNITSYQPQEAEKLLQAITVTCDSDEAKQDAITLKLTDKLNKMINPVNTMELLGF